MIKVKFKKEIIDKVGYNTKLADCGWYEELCAKREYGEKIVGIHDFNKELFSDPIDYKKIAESALIEKGDFVFKPTGDIKLSKEEMLQLTFNVSSEKVKEVLNRVDKMLGK